MSNPTGNRVPDSLSHPGLVSVWEAARFRLDRFGPQRRGSIALPVLDSMSALTLESLLGRKPGKRLDLSRIETALSNLRIGDDLCEALTRLGHPPSREAAEQRAARARHDAARTALIQSAATWPEPWATAWADSIITAGLLSGLDGPDATALVADVRRLLDHLDHYTHSEQPEQTAQTDHPVQTVQIDQSVHTNQTDQPEQTNHVNQTTPQGISRSRTEVAAVLYGSAHALDTSTKLAAFVTHALRQRLLALAEHEIGGTNDETSHVDEVSLDDGIPHDKVIPCDDETSCDIATSRDDETARVNTLTHRTLWEAAGIMSDCVSAPALTWGMPAIGVSALDEQLRAAEAGHLPVHVNLFSLQRHPVTVPLHTPILVVENPRMVEAAAERGLAVSVVASNGNPSTAVTTLLRQLQQSGASLWYHGDFDTSGLAICGRMHAMGCTPWMMSTTDYEDSIRLAQQARTPLGFDPKDCGPTPWDPSLQAAFNHHHLIIHEEYVLNSVLNGFLANSASA